jgi:REP element-mobilizing transposase RayT
MVQGINREFIFQEKEQIEIYKALLFKYAKKYEIKIIAYCVMNNHVHVLISSNAIKDMSKFFHGVNTIYASYYNKTNKRVGYVFRDRYKAEGIYSDEYLINCIAYIHNNPVKAKLVSDPGDYEYSSYNEYLNLKKIEMKEIFNNDLKFFKEIHSTNRVELFKEANGDIEEVIQKYKEDENMELKEIIEDPVCLKELVHLLKVENEISYREIERRIGIDRRILSKMIQ